MGLRPPPTSLQHPHEQGAQGPQGFDPVVFGKSLDGDAQFANGGLIAPFGLLEGDFVGEEELCEGGGTNLSRELGSQ